MSGLPAGRREEVLRERLWEKSVWKSADTHSGSNWGDWIGKDKDKDKERDKERTKGEEKGKGEESGGVTGLISKVLKNVEIGEDHTKGDERLSFKEVDGMCLRLGVRMAREDLKSLFDVSLSSPKIPFPFHLI